MVVQLMQANQRAIAGNDANDDEVDPREFDRHDRNDDRDAFESDGTGNKTLIQALQSNNERALQGQAQVFQTMIAVNVGRRSWSGQCSERTEFSSVSS